jgi:hypothetical protein
VSDQTAGSVRDSMFTVASAAVKSKAVGPDSSAVCSLQSAQTLAVLQPHANQYMFKAWAVITYKDNFTLALLYQTQNVIGGHYATV